MRCGFDEPSYFCQVFRRRAKLTPIEYRLKDQRRLRP
jgi:AraC-like DNA-binding protein